MKSLSVVSRTTSAKLAKAAFSLGLAYACCTSYAASISSTLVYRCEIPPFAGKRTGQSVSIWSTSTKDRYFLVDEPNQSLAFPMEGSGTPGKGNVVFTFNFQHTTLTVTANGWATTNQDKIQNKNSLYGDVSTQNNLPPSICKLVHGKVKKIFNDETPVQGAIPPSRIEEKQATQTKSSIQPGSMPLYLAIAGETKEIYWVYDDSEASARAVISRGSSRSVSKILTCGEGWFASWQSNLNNIQWASGIACEAKSLDDALKAALKQCQEKGSYCLSGARLTIRASKKAGPGDFTPKDIGGHTNPNHPYISCDDAPPYSFDSANCGIKEKLFSLGVNGTSR